MEGLGSGAQWKRHFFFLETLGPGPSQGGLQVRSGPGSGRVGSGEGEASSVYQQREGGGRAIAFVFVCEERAAGTETLVIIRWGDVTGPNGSLCGCQRSHFLFSTCPTWLPLADEI